MREIKVIQRKQLYHDNQINNAIKVAGKLLDATEAMQQSILHQGEALAILLTDYNERMGNNVTNNNR